VRAIGACGWGKRYFSGSGWHKFDPDYNDFLAGSGNRELDLKFNFIGDGSPSW
jgi:hypothetical protein